MTATDSGRWVWVPPDGERATPVEFKAHDAPILILSVLCGIVCVLCYWSFLEREAYVRARDADERALTAYSRAPPVEFVGGVEVRVRFTTDADVRAICGRGAAACWNASSNRIVVAHPCYAGLAENARRWRFDQWRDEMCHELAHVQGWRHVDPRQRFQP